MGNFYNQHYKKTFTTHSFIRTLSKLQLAILTVEKSLNFLIKKKH